MDVSPYKLLAEELGTQYGGLKCAHININGLVNKIDEVRLLLDETKLDIFAITETHLSKFTTDNEIDINGYHIIRRDRIGKSNHWGGTIIYYHHLLNLHEINIENNDLEAIWTEILLKSQKIIIGCVYRPPNDKHFVKRFRVIAEKFIHRSNLLFLGDFNIDMLAEQEPRQTREFKQTLYELNLTNVINTHTRITDRSKTLIDLILISDTNKVTKTGTFSPGISDHDLIYVNYKTHREKSSPKLIEVRNYRNVDQSKLTNDFEFAPWHLVDLFDDVDDSLWCWEYMFQDIISENIKTRKVKVRTTNQPWINGEIRKTLNERFKLLKAARLTNKNSIEWSRYKKLKNHCTNLIRSAKANYWKDEFGSADSPKQFWRTVKKFQNKLNKTNIGTLENVEGKKILDNAQKANELNNYFSSVGHTLSEDANSPAQIPHSYIHRVTPTIDKIKFDLETFSKAFYSAVKPGKSAGIDGITARDMKLNEKISINGLFKVAKKSFECRTFPSKWKTAKVSCIFKKGSTKLCSNYRPISLLSIPSKVIERFLCNQLQNHLTSLNLQNQNQWGFKTQRSTEDLLLHLTETWRKALDQKKVIGVIFLDFKKAFDSISHDILLQKLSACGISGEFHEYLSSYLKERKQYTVVNNVSSSIECIDYGVPQGSILGPICFTIHVDDMPDQIQCETNLFADDTSGYVIGDTVDEVLIETKSSLEDYERYSSKNSLTLHPDKCEVMILSKSKFIGPMPKLEVKGKEVKIVKSSKCLGLTIDNNLSWDLHVSHVCRSFRAKIKKLYHMRKMSKNILHTIYFQGILPSVLYCIIIWGNCSNYLMESIERIHIQAARFINRVKKNVTDNYVLQNCNWKTITYYYKRSIACKTYKIFNKLSSPILERYINKANSNQSTRNKQRLTLPNFKNTAYKNSFSYRSPIVWNNIPNNIREKPSIDSFKLSLSSEILDQINFGTNSTGRAREHSDFIYF